MPALITIHMARKPLDGTVAATALKYGTGSLNIEAARIGARGDICSPGDKRTGAAAGRWPANVILQHISRKGSTEGCRIVGSHDEGYNTNVYSDPREGNFRFYSESQENKPRDIIARATAVVVDDWVCVKGCPVVDIDEQSGVSRGSGRKQATGDFGKNGIYGKAMGVETQNYADKGGASRYFKHVSSNDDLIRYLRVMISTPNPDSDVRVLDSESMARTTCGDGQLTGVVWQGEINAEDVAQIARWLPPGGHIFRIAPDSQPTGHTGAILLEEAGFEIRDALLLVREPGRAHYVAKAGRKEREAGCGKLKGKAGHEAVERKEGSAGVANPRAGAGRTAGHVKNFHPTVKAIKIMERLLADVPAGHTVLDPFLGSGTTGIACLKTGHDFIGIEREAEYLEIADARVRHWDRAHEGWHGAIIESDIQDVQEEAKAISVMDFLDG